MSKRLVKSPPEWADAEADVAGWLNKTTWVRYWFRPTSDGCYIWVPEFLVLNEPHIRYESLTSPLVSSGSEDNSVIRPVFIEGANMSDTGKGSRRGQVGGGFVGGLKKGVLQSTTKRAASLAADVLPIKSEAAEGVAQFAILSLVAEIAEKIPAVVGDKVGLTDERKFKFGESCRNLAGENVGGHLVEAMTSIAPHLAEAFSQLSAKDMLGVAENIKAEGAEQEAEQPAKLEG